MKRNVLAAALLMSCLAVSACGDTKRIVTHIPTPPERLVCEPTGTRPAIPAENVIDLDRAAAAGNFASAMSIVQQEVRDYVASVRAREGIVAGYIVQTEGKLFTCSTNMQWRRDFEAGLARQNGGN